MDGWSMHTRRARPNPGSRTGRAYDGRHAMHQETAVCVNPGLQTPLRRGCRSALALLLALASAACAAAEAFPSRALTLLVPFPPGGSTDILARAVAQGLAKQLNQNVVIDNKAGAGGTVGAVQVLRAPADGHTLLLGTPAEQVNAPLLMAKPPYDPARDFEPVGCVVRFANVLVVNPKLPVHSVADLVRMAKAAPGKVNFGSAGNGNTSHLSGELFGQVAGVEITHVPYRGNAPAITDTIGGQVQMLFSSAASVAQHVASGALRALAVTGQTRQPLLPAVPTLREAGVPVEIYSFGCVMVAAKTALEIVEQLHGALSRALDDPAVAQVIEQIGGERFVGPREESRRFLARERQTWGHLIRTRNIKAE